MTNKKFGILLAMILIPLIASSQKSDSAKLPKIQVLARVTAQMVTLRWAPDNANAWLLGNRFGYTIERYTFLQNGKALETQTKRVLTSSPLKPWPLQEWKTMVDTSDFAAVAAQAIHGDDFEVDLNKKGDMTSILNKVKETESRYSFALHSANQSQTIAQASGLLFKDTSVQKNEAYLYRIYVNIPKEIMLVDTGIIFVDAGKPDKLPKLREVSVATSGNAVMITWTTSRYDRDYVSYTVERSEDGGHHFHALSNRPYASLGAEDGPMPGRAVYLDSVPQFNAPYFYRVRGFTSFAETGPQSDSVMVVAQKGLYNPPSVKFAEIINGKVIIHWEIQGETKDAVKGFNVERATNLQNNYMQLNKSLLSGDIRAFTDTVPATSNYYRIVAIDNKGNSHASLPYFVQPEDSIPPLPPLGMSGTIDSSGLVKLVWKKNMEADLLGYRVYRSYFMNSEFVQVTTDPIKLNHFSEKVKLKNLNKYLYYKITASDTHHNQSGFSIVLKVNQPDIMPPSAPAIASIVAATEGIKISLTQSNSDDVEKYLVYRKENTDSLWTLEKVIPSSREIIYYTDSTATFGNIYVYNVLAVDSSANESIPARSVKCKALTNNTKSALTLNITKDTEKKAIEIKWQSTRNDIVSILIYKATGDEPIAQYATCKAENGSFLDNNVKLNDKYRYMIKAVFEDKTESGFSKIETLIY
jgi:fibronectin type 3 domain-containing protein